MMEFSWNNNVVRLTLLNDLTANNMKAINEQLDKEMPKADQFHDFELDLKNTSNIDSVGVTFVINLYKRVKTLDRNFSVCGASDDVQSLFKLMKLDQFFKMVD